GAITGSRSDLIDRDRLRSLIVRTRSALHVHAHCAELEVAVCAHAVHCGLVCAELDAGARRLISLRAKGVECGATMLSAEYRHQHRAEPAQHDEYEHRHDGCEAASTAHRFRECS